MKRKKRDSGERERMEKTYSRIKSLKNEPIIPGQIILDGLF